MSDKFSTGSTATALASAPTPIAPDRFQVQGTIAGPEPVAPDRFRVQGTVAGPEPVAPDRFQGQGTVAGPAAANADIVTKEILLALEAIFAAPPAAQPDSTEVQSRELSISAHGRTKPLVSL